MRVRFFGQDEMALPGDGPDGALGFLESEAETGRYLALIAEMDEFWRLFAQRRESAARAWLPELRQRLAQIAPGLGLEVREAEAGTRTLCVVVVGECLALPLAHLLVERAPKLLPWVVQVGREPLTLNQVLAHVRRDHGYDLTEARARVGVVRGHLLDVLIASPDFKGPEDEAAALAAQALVQGVMGDLAFEQWIGGLDVAPAPRHSAARRGGLRLVGDGAQSLPLGMNDLLASIQAAGRGILDGLPEWPCHAVCERAPWVMFDIEPGEQINSATTMCPEMLKCFLAGGPFSSGRFSRHGERFCYLQLELTDTESEDALAQRMRLEDRLNRMLVPGRLGCVVGTAQGERYSFIYLALQQLEPCLPLLRRALASELPQAELGWLRFCDDEWGAEWLSLTPNASPPP